MSSAAEYCKSCEFPFKQMGACPMPEKSMFWAYLSMLPYILPIIIFLSCILLKNMSQFKLSSMLASSYISGDKLVKNLIKSTPALKQTPGHPIPANRATACRVHIWSSWLPSPSGALETANAPPLRSAFGFWSPSQKDSPGSSLITILSSKLLLEWRMAWHTLLFLRSCGP